MAQQQLIVFIIFGRTVVVYGAEKRISDRMYFQYQPIVKTVLLGLLDRSFLRS
jgi:hypothetical protein